MNTSTLTYSKIHTHVSHKAHTHTCQSQGTYTHMSVIRRRHATTYVHRCIQQHEKPPHRYTHRQRHTHTHTQTHTHLLLSSFYPTSFLQHLLSISPSLSLSSSSHSPFTIPRSSFLPSLPFPLFTSWLFCKLPLLSPPPSPPAPLALSPAAPLW